MFCASQMRKNWDDRNPVVAFYTIRDSKSASVFTLVTSTLN